MLQMKDDFISCFPILVSVTNAAKYWLLILLCSQPRGKASSDNQQSLHTPSALTASPMNQRRDTKTHTCTHSPEEGQDGWAEKRTISQLEELSRLHSVSAVLLIAPSPGVFCMFHLTPLIFATEAERTCPSVSQSWFKHVNQAHESGRMTSTSHKSSTEILQAKCVGWAHTLHTHS